MDSEAEATIARRYYNFMNKKHPKVIPFVKKDLKIIYYSDVKGSEPIYIKKDNSALIREINKKVEPNYDFGI